MPGEKTSIIIKKKPSIATRRKQTMKIKQKKQDKKHSLPDTETTKTIIKPIPPTKSKSKILISKIKKKPAPTTTVKKSSVKVKVTVTNSDDNNPEDKTVGRSSELNADCFKIIRKIDPKNKLSREQLIYQLETLRYKLRNKLEADPYNNTIIKYYNNVALIICDVKEKDIGNKVEINEQEKQKIIDSFKQKFKKMEEKQFARVVDLTAPKEERKPEVGFTIWDKSKKVIYKDKDYKKPTNMVSRKFNKFNIQKSMDDTMVKQLDERLEKNLHKYNIIEQYPQVLKYQTYNPMTYDGVKWC